MSSRFIILFFLIINRKILIEYVDKYITLST